MKIKFTLLLVLLTILITSCQPKTVAEIREQEDNRLREDVEHYIERLELHVSEMSEEDLKMFSMCKFSHLVAEDKRIKEKLRGRTSDIDTPEEIDRRTLKYLIHINSNLD
jgi:hypothetical protein